MLEVEEGRSIADKVLVLAEGLMRAIEAGMTRT